MSGVNKVILLGRVGKDPEIKTFNGGGKIAQFSVATSETWRDKQTGERKEKTEWSNIVVKHDGMVEVVEKYVKKGDQIYLEGKIETRKWQDQQGNDRYATEIVVTGFGGKIQLIGGKKSDGERSGGGEGSPSNDRKPAAAARPEIDDDIPF